MDMTKALMGRHEHRAWTATTGVHATASLATSGEAYMMPDESNMLLRSAFQIAQRNGENTNWQAFLLGLRRELLRQAGVSNAEADEQLVLRATCTPRTYRIPSEVKPGQASFCLFFAHTQGDPKR